MTKAVFKTFAVLGATLVVAACGVPTERGTEGDSQTDTRSDALTSREVATGEQTIRSYARDVLGREAGDAEIAYWEGRADAVGLTAVARVVVGSDEARRIVVNGYYRAFFGREGDSGGVVGYAANPQFVAGRPADVVSALLGSGEYYLRNGSNDYAFVAGLYRDVLGRAASDGEIRMWLGQARASRVNLARAFYTSDESSARIAAGWYGKYMRRAVDGGTQGNIVAGLRAGMSQWDILANILSTPEYVAVHRCVATTCAAAGAHCGTIANGCGGVTDCGGCGAGSTCTANQCIAACTPRSVEDACEFGFLNCGSVPDGCGGSIACGACDAPETCGGAGTPNVCGGGGVICLASCPDGACGLVPDGCGGALNCGRCKRGGGKRF